MQRFIFSVFAAVIFVSFSRTFIAVMQLPGSQEVSSV